MNAAIENTHCEAICISTKVGGSIDVTIFFIGASRFSVFNGAFILLLEIQHIPLLM